MLDFSIKNGALIIKPVEALADKKKHSIKKIADPIIEEYVDVFEKLAK